MPFGAFGPWPFRFGPSKGQSLEAITNSLLAQLGTAYTSDAGSLVWVKAHATARELWATLEANQRFRNQFNPNKLSAFLDRWEAIYGITPPPGATDWDRRLAIAARWTVIGKRLNTGGLIALLQTLLPNTFAALVHTPSSRAIMTAPLTVAAGTGGAPTGTNNIDNGGNPSNSNLVAGYWNSTAHFVAIQVKQPAAMSNAAFYSEVGRVYDGTLRRLLPAWVTFGWFRDLNARPGFFLDDPTNLDNERLLDVVWNQTPIGGAAFTQAIFPIEFSQNLIGPGTYANYYGFNVPTPETLTISISRSGSGIAAYVMGPGTSSTVLPVVASGVGGASLTLHTGTLAAGDYVLEINSNAVDTRGVSPFTAQNITITTP